MAHQNIEYFRENLRRACLGYGKVSEIAKAAGITRVYLSMVIHGKADPSLEVACNLADAVGIPIEVLFRKPARVRQAS